MRLGFLIYLTGFLFLVVSSSPAHADWPAIPKGYAVNSAITIMMGENQEQTRLEILRDKRLVSDQDDERVWKGRGETGEWIMKNPYKSALLRLVSEQGAVLDSKELGRISSVLPLNKAIRAGGNIFYRVVEIYVNHLGSAAWSGATTSMYTIENQKVHEVKYLDVKTGKYLPLRLTQALRIRWELYQGHEFLEWNGMGNYLHRYFYQEGEWKMFSKKISDDLEVESDPFPPRNQFP